MCFYLFTETPEQSQKDTWVPLKVAKTVSLDLNSSLQAKPASKEFIGKPTKSVMFDDLDDIDLKRDKSYYLYYSYI